MAICLTFWNSSSVIFLSIDFDWFFGIGGGNYVTFPVSDSLFAFISSFSATSYLVFLTELLLCCSTVDGFLAVGGFVAGFGGMLFVVVMAPFG